MENEELMKLAEKIKNKTASQEEITKFTEEFGDLVSSLKNDLKS